MFLFIYNYISNLLINDYRYNVLSFTLLHIVFVKIFKMLCIYFNVTQSKLDISLFFIALFTTCITALSNSWDLFFPEFFPFVFIFCSFAIWLIYFYKENYKYYILVLILLSFITGQFIVSPYYYNKEKLESTSKENIILSDFQVKDLNNNLINIDTKKYKLSIICLSFIDCLPCNKLDEVFYEDIYVPNKENQDILMMKINPIDKIERIKQTYKKETLSYIYVDDNEIIKQKYQVEGYPVLLLFNKKGQIIKRFDGYKPEFKMNYLKEVNEIINQETL